MRRGSLSRRQFLRLGGAAAVGAGAVGWATRPAWAADKPVSANDRIVLGFIGVGGMGRAHFDGLLPDPQVQIVAAADPDRQRQASAKEKAAEANCAIDTYTDFRELLDRSDIDAVFVATPDHWHAIAAIEAMKRGKDVYCEKPLTLTIAEGQAMVDTARRYGRVVQMGTQQRSDQKQFLHVCRLVRSGRIGELKRAVCFFGANPWREPEPDEAPPDYLDWDLWLGPAPYRPFNKCIHPYNFRYFRDYSGGLLTDWGVHLFDIAQWGAGKDETGPKRIEAEGRMYQKPNMFEYPEVCRIVYDYGDVTIEWHQGTGERFEDREDYGTKFYGTEGEAFVNRSGYKLYPKGGKAIDETFGPSDARLYDSRGHHQDFFDCMRTRQRPICDVAIGHRSTSISHLGNIAFRLGRPVEFDPDRQVFVNDPVADKMLSKPMRGPWHV